jgi:tetratricopeptide (TPR) repeat protein
MEVEVRRGDGAAADAATDEAHARVAALAADDPGNRDYRLGLAQALVARRVPLGRAGRSDEAAAGLREAQTIYEELAAGFPEWVAVRNELSTLYRILGWQAAARGDAAAAAAFARQGVEADRALRDRFPAAPLSYSRLAESWAFLAEVRCHAGEPAGAEAAFREAVAADDRLRALPLDNPDRVRLYTFAARQWLGQFLVGRGRHAEAEAELGACAAEAERFSAAYPTESLYWATRARCYSGLGQAAYLAGREADARAWFVKAAGALRAPALEGHAAVFMSLALRVPVPGVFDPAGLTAGVARSEAGASPLNVGLAAARAGDDPTAEGHLRAAVGSAGRADSRGEALYQLAACLARRGAPAEARAAFDRAEREDALRYAADGAVRVARREAERLVRPDGGR